jgi:hypothetical protein
MENYSYRNAQTSHAMQAIRHVSDLNGARYRDLQDLQYSTSGKSESEALPLSQKT